jgi:hypothetical protein
MLFSSFHQFFASQQPKAFSIISTAVAMKFIHKRHILTNPEKSYDLNPYSENGRYIKKFQSSHMS